MEYEEFCDRITFCCFYVFSSLCYNCPRFTTIHENRAHEHFKSLVFGCMESLQSLKMFFMRLKLDFARFMLCLISFSHLASAVSQDPKYLKS